jgi:hypothetical protein
MSRRETKAQKVGHPPQEEADKMGGEREVTVQTPGGQKGSRRLDAAKTDENGKIVDCCQVIRPNKNGTPPKREVDAANDIQNATGVRPRFVPVKPQCIGCEKPAVPKPTKD